MRRRRPHGLTLMESLLAATVLAGATTSMLWPFVAGAQAQQEAQRQAVAACLAQELMEEILSKPFHDPQGPSAPGPEEGERTRAQFDNADDYHGYAEAAGEVAAFDGEVSDDPTAADLGRSVTATYVYVPGQDTSGEASFLTVTVTVERGGAAVVRLTRLVYDMNGS